MDNSGPYIRYKERNKIGEQQEDSSAASIREVENSTPSIEPWILEQAKEYVENRVREFGPDNPEAFRRYLMKQILEGNEPKFKPVPPIEEPEYVKL
jgi:hypothetical protein